MWRKAAASFGAHPGLWALAALSSLAFIPGVDLTVSGWFFRPGEGFFLKTYVIPVFVLKTLPVILLGLAAGILVAAVAGRLSHRVFFGVTGRIAVYLLASLAVGPGLIVNAILKDHWGRARPSQIIEFGGMAHFTAPLVPADQCAANCSFASGHGALGFWMFAFALLAPPSRRGLAMAVSLAFGAFVGLARIAQGGHFLTDTVASGAIVIIVSMWLHRHLIEVATKPGPDLTRS